MTDTEKIEAGMAQMGFEMVDNGNIEIPSSKPAMYAFTEPATYDPESFKEEIEQHDFGITGEVTTEKDSGEFYYFVEVVTDHYKSIKVKIWPDQVRLFPKEEGIDTYEFSRLIHAIEDGFGSDLEHTKDD